MRRLQADFDGFLKKIMQMKTKEKKLKNEKMDDYSALHPPSCPQADRDGVIDVTLVSDPIVIRVPPYFNMIEGDVIIAFFNNVKSAPEVVPLGTPPGKPVDLFIHKNTLYSGYYYVWYRVIDKAGNISTPSEFLRVKIINGLSGVLPPPVFPQAGGKGVISYQDVKTDGGVFMHSSYPHVLTGNLVIFYWQGYDANGNFVAASSYSSPVFANDNDMIAGYVVTKIPADKVLILGEQGKGGGHYVLYPEGVHSMTYYPSLTADIILYDKIGGGMKLFTTIGAALRSDKYPDLQPKNYGVVFGPPGITIQISVSPGANIADAQGSGSSAVSRLDENGKCTFTVYEKDTNASGGLIQVNIVQNGNLGNHVEGGMSFMPYRIAGNGISRYNYTTNAINDGKMPNSVYLIAEAGVASLYATVTGNAKINGLDNKLLTIPVINGVATINIINEHAETITVKVAGNIDMFNAIEFQVVFSNGNSFV